MHSCSFLGGQDFCSGGVAFPFIFSSGSRSVVVTSELGWGRRRRQKSFVIMLVFFFSLRLGVSPKKLGKTKRKTVKMTKMNPHVWSTGLKIDNSQRDRRDDSGTLLFFGLTGFPPPPLPFFLSLSFCLFSAPTFHFRESKQGLGARARHTLVSTRQRVSVASYV